MGKGKSPNPSEGPKPEVALVYASSGEAKAM